MLNSILILPTMSTSITKLISIFLALFFLCACDPNSKQNADKSISGKDYMLNYKRKIDSANYELQWHELKCGLWQSKNGDLGLQTVEGTESGESVVKYITEMCCDGILIKTIVDTASFKYLGSSFYKDKNHVYTHYAMADGGNFWIVDDADVKTFEVIGDCYAKDKNYIFGERAMIMDSLDYQSFRTIKGNGCYAKDKNGYYFWDEKININELDDEVSKQAIDKLKSLK